MANSSTEASGSAPADTSSYLGYAQAFSAYALWGVFPIYWKLLPGVGSIEIICHRIVWSFLTLLACIVTMRQWPAFRDAIWSPRKLRLSVLAAVLITINWLAFIWAVANDRILEASLGYFINPLFTVLLAVFLFRERLTRVQWIAILIAFLGVGIMSLEANRIPWVALALSTSFASYAAVKKKTQLPAIAGLGLETAILTPVALALILFFGMQSTSQAPRSVNTWMLLALGGPVTTLPLLLFAEAARKVPLVAIGMLQYVGPTIQFLIALFVYHEQISSLRMLGFCFVWGALALFTWGSLVTEFRSKHRK